VKKMILALALLLSPSAFAQSIDFSAFDKADHPDMRKMHQCLKKSWNAATPSDQQKEEAKRFMDEAKAEKDLHEDAIEAAMEAMKTAWGKYPIVQAEVVAAEDALREQATPVKAAFRDAGINTLNLLSAEQRETFDSTFKSCID
jgi:hypothetical protein